MKTVLPQVRKPCRLFRSVAAPATMAMLVVSALAQDSQFLFDDTGNLTVQTTSASLPPQILVPPQDQVVMPGALASFSIVVANTHGLTYQWRFYGTNLSGASGDALLLTNVVSANVGLYSVVLANSSGSVTSAPAVLMLDGDRDGMPDAWEQTYLGGTGQHPTGDFDGRLAVDFQIGRPR